jgi:hypothetical protein
VAELEPLLAQVVQHGLAARRVVYNLDAWDPAPGTVVMGGSLIRLDGYRMLSPRFVHLILTGAALPLVLLVIPPPAG